MCVFRAFFVRFRSPSPRRAWIEIMYPIYHTDDKVVALPTEGVD